MTERIETCVQKACGYVTRPDGRLLVFEEPEYDGLQVPKGTVEADETPREALVREVAEETGLDDLTSVTHLTTDVWLRRASPRRWYVRHFFHATVREQREEWTHTVTGEGEECGLEFECSWIDLPTERDFALSLDDYVDHLAAARPRVQR